MQLIRIVRSFGLVWIREKILDSFKISFYGTFKRPSDWAKNEELKEYIDRITFESGLGTEYRYSKDYYDIHKRYHSENTSTYGELEKTNLTKEDIRILMVASNYFPFWFIIYIVKRSFRKIFK